MGKYSKFIVLMGVLILLKATSLFALPERYQIINLGLQKYEASRVISINNQGWISGLLSNDNYLTIFVLDQDKNIALRPQDNTGTNLIINNLNEVFGSVIYRQYQAYWEYDEQQIFKWINPFNYYQYFNFYYLGYPDGQHSGPFHFKTNFMWDANDLGQVLVMNCEDYDEVISEFNKVAVWIYDKKKFIKIVDPYFQAGFKINNHSQILGSYLTGSSLTENREEHVSVYHYQDKTTRLFDFPSESFGADLNDKGQVVGSFYHPENQIWKGFLAEPTGEILDLQNFSPALINNQGIVVGIYTEASNKKKIGVWENGSLYDLMDLVSLVDDTGNTWDSIISIEDINDQGDMIGQGKINGVIHGFLLKPLP